jgi:hypothetical protein
MAGDRHRLLARGDRKGPGADRRGTDRSRRAAHLAGRRRHLADLSPGAADLVLVAYLHLVPDAFDRVLGSAVEALAPGGTLLVVGHDLRNLTEGVSGPQDPERLHDPVQIRARLEESGLTVVLAETVERPTDAGVALDTLVRARRD